MKPKLKAPGTKRLNLKYDELLSSFAFNCNLLRYTKGSATSSERIGRESTTILDRQELVNQLLARDGENAGLTVECAQLRHDMELMTEALRQVVEAQETAAGYGGAA